MRGDHVVVQLDAQSRPRRQLRPAVANLEPHALDRTSRAAPAAPSPGSGNWGSPPPDGPRPSSPPDRSGCAARCWIYADSAIAAILRSSVIPPAWQMSGCATSTRPCCQHRTVVPLAEQPLAGRQPERQTARRPLSPAHQANPAAPAPRKTAAQTAPAPAPARSRRPAASWP